MNLNRQYYSYSEHHCGNPLSSWLPSLRTHIDFLPDVVYRHTPRWADTFTHSHSLVQEPAKA